MKIFGIEVLPDEQVPRDEVWLVREVEPRVEITDRFAIVRRGKIVAKIVNLESPSVSLLGSPEK